MVVVVDGIALIKLGAGNDFYGDGCQFVKSMWKVFLFDAIL